MIISWPGPDAAKQPKLCCLPYYITVGMKTSWLLAMPFSGQMLGLHFFGGGKCFSPQNIEIIETNGSTSKNDVNRHVSSARVPGKYWRQDLYRNWSWYLAFWSCHHYTSLSYLIPLVLPRPAAKTKIHNKKLRESVRPHKCSWTMGEVAIVETCTNGPGPIKLPRDSCSGNMTSVLFHKHEVRNRATEISTHRY